MRIELHSVGKRFGRVHALRDVTLAVPEGSRVGLIGPNGSGKTTLTRIVMGIVAGEGRVTIGGLSPFRDRLRLARRLAYVPQAPPTLGATVRELVRAVARVRDLPVEGIAMCAARLRLDVEAIERRPFRDLSGGMKQKLLIAMALAADASLLVMDEPTAGLDVDARRSFFASFDAVPASTTLVLCSHRLEELQHLIDHVIVLEEGRLAYHGALDAFLDRRATSVLEVRTRGASRAPWLRERGFVPGAANWWSKTVARAEKLAEIGRLAGEMQGELADLLVRDDESVGADGHGRRAAP